MIRKGYPCGSTPKEWALSCTVSFSAYSLRKSTPTLGSTAKLQNIHLYPLRAFG